MTKTSFDGETDSPTPALEKFAMTASPSPAGELLADAGSLLDVATKRYPQIGGTHRQAFIDGARWAADILGKQCDPEINPHALATLCSPPPAGNGMREAAARRRKMNVMTLVRGDDWEGIYIAGKLMTEGHSIELTAGIVLAIEHKVTGITTVFCDLDWLHEEGNLPQALDDVKRSAA